jgi:peptidoglycan endopeptidase LytE
MLLRKLFPPAVSACAIIGIFSISIHAQTVSASAAQVAEYGEVSCSPDEVVYEAEPAPEEMRANKALIGKSDSNPRLQQLITAAIDERLGSRYRWGGTGPNTFDCSGFVWRIFQAAGVTFERGSARTLWSRFEPVSPEEQFKFGTLVFFSGLAHVGVVVDEHGFYHASRHHGVVYSPFNDYWVKRIDGFRRVPLTTARAD